MSQVSETVVRNQPLASKERSPIRYDIALLLSYRNSTTVQLPQDTYYALKTFHLIRGDVPIDCSPKPAHTKSVSSQKKGFSSALSIKATTQSVPSQKSQPTPIAVQKPKIEAQRKPFSNISNLDRSKLPATKQLLPATKQVLSPNKVVRTRIQDKENFPSPIMVKEYPIAIEKIQLPKLSFPALPIVADTKVDSKEDILPVHENDKIRENDPHRLEQRQKQIDYGHNSVGYQNYIKEVPKSKRIPRDPHHPVTPRKTQKCSKRSWDGQVRKWRRELHFWDPSPSELREFEQETINTYFDPSSEADEDKDKEEIDAPSFVVKEAVAIAI